MVIRSRTAVGGLAAAIAGPCVSPDLAVHLCWQLGGEWLGLATERERGRIGLGASYANLPEQWGRLAVALEAALLNLG